MEGLSPEAAALYRRLTKGRYVMHDVKNGELRVYTEYPLEETTLEALDELNGAGLTLTKDVLVRIRYELKEPTSP